MVHVRRAARLAFASVASVLALLVMVAAPQPASADSGAMVVPITSVEEVTGQVGAYCRSGLPHTGIDISANTGDPVYSAYGGTLQRFTQASLGTHIIVTHVDGYSTLYAHLSGCRGRTRRVHGQHGPAHRLRRHHRQLDRGAPALRGAAQRCLAVRHQRGVPVRLVHPGPHPHRLVLPRAARRGAGTAGQPRGLPAGELDVLRPGGQRGDAPLGAVRHHRRPAGVGHFGDSTVDNQAVYRPSTSTFYVRGVNGALLGSVKFGRTGDLPVVGHFQDSLNDNVAVYRPSSSTFYIRAHGGALLSSTRFGRTGDLPVVGRFEDAPVDNLAVYRPSISTFYVRALDGSLLTTIKYGAAGDLPVVGHLQGSAPDNLGRFRPSSATFAIRAQWVAAHLGRLRQDRRPAAGRQVPVTVERSPTPGRCTAVHRPSPGGRPIVRPGAGRASGAPPGSAPRRAPAPRRVTPRRCPRGPRPRSRPTPGPWSTAGRSAAPARPRPRRARRAARSSADRR